MEPMKNTRGRGSGLVGLSLCGQEVHLVARPGEPSTEATEVPLLTGLYGVDDPDVDPDAHEVRALALASARSRGRRRPPKFDGRAGWPRRSCSDDRDLRRSLEIVALALHSQVMVLRVLDDEDIGEGHLTPAFEDSVELP